MISTALRNEALAMLEGKGAILDTAREVSEILRETGIAGGVIGGVAVVLHGHVRTTVDVDVFVTGPLKPFGDALREAGYVFDSERKEFTKIGVPIHLVTLDEIRIAPQQYLDLEEIRTVGLADLISMKLRSGSEDPLRAQDLADVVGLIRSQHLTGEFACHIDKSQRPTFRKLARMVRDRENK